MSVISIIGAGAMAAAIGGLAARAGHAVELTSRDAEKARGLARHLGPGTTVGAFGAVPAGDLVILAVPYEAAIDVVTRWGRELSGKVLVDITNPINSRFTDFTTPEGSCAALEIAKRAPADVDVIKAFNTLSSQVLASASAKGHRLDVFLAGDSAQAKARVSIFVDSLGLRPLDSGQLSMAKSLEQACMLTLGLRSYSIKHADFAIGVGLLS